MSAGHIYNYFSNKEAIIEALVELRTQEFLDMIDTDKFADLPPEERMDKELGQVPQPRQHVALHRDHERGPHQPEGL